MELVQALLECGIVSEAEFSDFRYWYGRGEAVSC